MADTDTKSIKWLAGGHFINDMYSSFLVPILPFVAAKLSLSIATISAIISLSHLTSSIAQPIFGFISDKMKRRFFLIWGVVFCSIFVPLAGAMDTVFMLALCMIIGTTGNAFFHPQATGLVTVFNHQNPKLTKYMGLFLAMGSIGYALGPMVSSAIAEKFGLEALPAAGIVGIAYAIMLYFNVPKIPKSAVAKSNVSFAAVIKDILKSKPMMILIYISTAKSVVSMSFSTFTPFLFKELGYGMGIIGAATTALFITGGIATMASSKFENIFGTKNVFRISFLGILPLTIIFLLTYKTYPAISFASYGLLGFFIFLSVSVNMVMAQKLIPNHRGMISGVIGGFSWGIAGLSLTPLGFLASHIGVTKVLLAVAVITFSSTYLIKFLPDVKKLNPTDN